MQDVKKRGPGRPFVKGDPRAGRPPDPAGLRELKKHFTYSEFKMLMFRMLLLNPEELKIYKGPAIEMALASIVHKAIISGDPQRIEFFLCRLFGKVPDKMEVTAVDELKQLSDQELLERVVQDVEQFKTKLIKGGNS